MRFGVIVFPGTWSDRDCYFVLKDVLGQEVDYIWHQDTDLSRYDCLILPEASPMVITSGLGLSPASLR